MAELLSREKHDKAKLRRRGRAGNKSLLPKQMHGTLMT